MVKCALRLWWAIALFFCLCATARADVLPGGFVALPDGNGATISAGVSAGIDVGDCCWMGRVARFIAWQPPSADRLIVELFAPRYALRRRERVDAVVNGVEQHVCCARPGGSELFIALTPCASVKRLTVELRFAHDFRPVDVGKGPDRRRLSVLLRGIAFDDTRTGAQLKGRTEPSPPPLLPRDLRAVIALAGFLAAVLVSLTRPSLGIAALIVTGPFTLAVDGFGTTLTLPKAALLGVTLALLIACARRIPRFGPAFGVIGVTLALDVLCAAISAHGAGDIHAALRETLKLIEYALAFVVAYVAYRRDPSAPILMRALAATTLAVIALSVTQVALGAAPTTQIDGRTFPRLAGPLEGPNQLAGFLDLAAPLLLAAAFARSRASAWLALAAATLGLALTLSRGGIIAGIAGALVVFIARLRPGRLRVAYAGLFAIWGIGIAISLAVGFGMLRGADGLFGSIHDLRGGLGTRTLLWHNAVTLWLAHPWFGVGPGNFELHSYAMSGVRTHANSLYLNTLAETGIAGFAAIVAFTLAPLAVLARYARNWIVAGVLGACVALALHHVVDTLWIYPKVGTLWMVLLGVGAALCDTLADRDEVVDLSPEML